MKTRKISCPENKLKIKCPYGMTPTRIVIHNTANNATAENEIKYMHSNNNETSFHFAVDDKEAVQGIELNRNAWHAGDGNGKGNREGIAIEICYSESGGEKWLKAVDNAAELTAELLKQYGWGTDRVTKHADYAEKNCPHRILDEYGWDNFLSLVKKKLNADNAGTDFIYRVKTNGKWLPEVKNTEDYAGIKGKAVTDIAVKVTNGKVKYRVHVYKGKWLPYVSGYSITDKNNGYAGNGRAIDAVEIILDGSKKALYRVSPINKSYYPWQSDNDITDGMDGYAGAYGRKIDRVQIKLKQ